MENLPENAVDKYTASSSSRRGDKKPSPKSSGLSASLLQNGGLGEYSLERGDSRASEGDDLYMVGNILHHKLQHTPTNSIDNRSSSVNR